MANRRYQISRRVANEQLVRQVVIAPHVKDFAVRCVLATHPEGEFAAPAVNQFVRYGSSPRGAQAIVLGSKVRALLDGRYNVSFDDIAEVAPSALRHRLILNFEGEAEGSSSCCTTEKSGRGARRRARSSREATTTRTASRWTCC